MASTYSTNLKIELIGTGEQAGTWGTTTNTNLGTALEQSIVGKADVAMSSTTITLTLNNSNAAQDARAIYLNLTGSPGGAAVLEVPAVQKPYIVKNGSDQQVTIKVSGQTGVAVPVGSTMWLYNNGSDVTVAVDNLPSNAKAGGANILVSGGALGTPASGTLTNATGLPISTGVSGLGANVATFLATPSSTNLQAAVTDETGTGALVFAGSPTFTGTVTTAAIAMADNLLTRAVLKDYAVEGQSVGNTGATRTLDLNDANFFSATLDQACTFTFSDPPASGDFGCFVLQLTNGGAFAITWPASVDWPGGNAPSLTASGIDQLVFTTSNGGTTWYGFVAGLDLS